ncbi:MAG TPA: response regulator transcription factor [Caldilineaceae bacterium]|nr:response regulator transcription factor [Caldilineaceae bacterium]
MDHVTTQPIRILIADDHAVVREGIQSLIAIKPDMQVVGEAKDGFEAASKARALQPDVILLDMLMPRMNGLDAICEIKTYLPDARILILTSFAEDDKVLPAIRAGALGYLLKDSSPQELIAAIRDVYHGQSALHPTIARMVIGELRQPTPAPSPVDALTEREIETIQLVAEGLSNQEIADCLMVSNRTVGKHVSSILDKLALENRTQIALYALRSGLAELKPL